jgi:hypothetical protein
MGTLPPHFWQNFLFFSKRIRVTSPILGGVLQPACLLPTILTILYKNVASEGVICLNMPGGTRHVATVHE